MTATRKSAFLAKSPDGGATAAIKIIKVIKIINFSIVHNQSASYKPGSKCHPFQALNFSDLAKLAVANLMGPLECYLQTVCPINFQVFFYWPLKTLPMGSFTRWIYLASQVNQA